MPFNFGESFLNQMNIGQQQAVNRQELELRAKQVSEQILTEQVRREALRHDMELASQQHQLAQDIFEQIQLPTAEVNIEGTRQDIDIQRDTHQRNLDSVWDLQERLLAAQGDLTEEQIEGMKTENQINAANLERFLNDQIPDDEHLFAELGLPEGKEYTHREWVTNIGLLAEKEGDDARMALLRAQAKMANMQIEAFEELGRLSEMQMIAQQNARDSRPGSGIDALSDAGLVVGADIDGTVRSTWGLPLAGLTQYVTRSRLNRAIKSGQYTDEDVEFLSQARDAIPRMPDLGALTPGTGPWDQGLRRMRAPANFGLTAEEAQLRSITDILNSRMGRFGSEFSMPFTPFYGGGATGPGNQFSPHQFGHMNQFNILQGGGFMPPPTPLLPEQPQ